MNIETTNIQTIYSTRFKTMQTSFSLVSSMKPTTQGAASAHEEGEYNRGIFKITIPPISVEGGGVVRQKMRFIVYASVDASGSMGETATRRGQVEQTKMDFVHATIKNMIDYIASQQDENPHVEFYLAIVSFDSFASCVLLPCRVTKENKDNLIETVMKIRPSGGTNFEKCFREIARLMANESDYINPDANISDEFTQRMHIFLTDGANNEGVMHVSQLASMLTPTLAAPQKPATQIMIGYGPDHDSAMLQTLCAKFPKSKQWFIDDVEKTGCIFGEILWSAMNAAYTNVALSSNVELYDFTSMSWKTQMQVDDLTYDSSRTFYVRVPWTVDAVVCDMTYFSTECPGNTTHKTEKLLTYLSESDHQEPQTQPDQSVEQELWRLDTIVTVHEALKFLQNMNRLSYNALVEEKNRLVGVVTTFQEKFLSYVAEKNLSEDPFMIQLADDLFVCISGLMAASIGERYIAARQASQIQQRSVTVNDITPLQTEILSYMPITTPHSNSYASLADNDSCYFHPPQAPRRTYSSGGCVDNDTHVSDVVSPQPSSSSPRTPTHVITSVTEIDPVTEEARQEEETKENDKIVSDFTPTSRGVGSRLRHLSRDAILEMRGKNRNEGAMYSDEDYMYSQGGDEVFSCHASPGCARIGRMLSAPRLHHNSAPERTPTAPF